MSRSASSTPPARRADSVLLSLLRQPLRLGLWLGASLVVSIVLEWIGVLLWWPELGARHSHGVLQAEIRHLGAAFGKPLGSLPPPREIGFRLVDRMGYLLLEWTGLRGALQWLGTVTGVRLIGELARATVNTAQVFTVRLTIIVLTLPLFALAAAWGSIEGLIRRDLRKFGADIERGFWYHLLKKWSFVVIVLPLSLYLAMPFSINPVLIFLPFAAGFAVLLMGTTTLFIKHA